MTPQPGPWAEMSPYELGLSGSAEAIPFLVRHLRSGGANDRRLAASALRKLAVRHRNACQTAVAPLADLLAYPAPQVR